MDNNFFQFGVLLGLSESIDNVFLEARIESLFKLKDKIERRRSSGKDVSKLEAKYIKREASLKAEIARRKSIDDFKKGD